MESKAIEKLLDKYFEGETSLQEEKQIRTYFSSEKVAPELREYQPLFGYFDREKNQRYSGKVWSSGRRKVYSWVAVAASIVLMMGIVNQENRSVHDFGTYEDPELALQKTKEALQMVSSLMNSGTEDLGYLQEFNTAKNKVLKTP